MTKFKRGLAKVGAGVASVAAAGSAFATAPNYSTLSDAVDFTSAGTAILAVAGVLAGVLVLIKGARIVLGMIRR